MSEFINLGNHGKRHLKDQVTPHKIVLLVLVQEYCTMRARDAEQIIQEPQNAYTETEERELMFMLLQLVQV